MRVLVPLDGSALAEAILPYVRHGLEPASLTLLRVVSSADRAAAADAKTELALLAERLRGEGIADIATIVREGAPANAILSIAAETSPTLIALTTHGRSGFDRLVLGSVAEKVIRASPVPVLALRAPTTPPGAEPPRLFSRVLVPYDGSEVALRAVHTLAVLDQRRRSRIRIFAAVRPLEVAPHAPGALNQKRYLVEEVAHLQQDDAMVNLERAAACARAMGFEADVSLEFGRPATAILDCANAIEATLIAMTTHGRSGITRWTLGSVTEHVLRETTVPLLVCR